MPAETSDLNDPSEPAETDAPVPTDDVIPLGTDGEIIDLDATPGETQNGLDSLGNALKKLGRVVLIGAAVIVVGLVLIIALARAGKNKK
jgi:hypothetical protein